MDTKAAFIFLVSLYVLIVILSSLLFNKSPGHFVLPYIVVLVITLIYFSLSIFITYKLYQSGSFHWISIDPNIIKIVLISGLTAIIYSIYSSIMMRMDWATYSDQSITNLKNFLHYSSYIWVPLLMIIPYYFLIYRNDSIMGIYVKIPLIVNVSMGIILYLYFHSSGFRNMISGSGSLFSSKDSRILKNIESTNQVIDLLQYTKPIYDIKIREAISDKVLSNPDYESQLLEILSDCKNYYPFMDIYPLLIVRPIVNQEKYIEPLNKSMDCVINFLNIHNDNPYAPKDYLQSLNIDYLITVLDYQFSFHYLRFKDKLIQLESTLKQIKRENFKKEAQELLYQLEKLNVKHRGEN